MDLANPLIMAQFANAPTTNDLMQQSLLNSQSIEHNQNLLAQQQRAEDARRALVVATDPNAAPEQRAQGMAALQQADPQQAYALRMQMQRQQQLASYFQKPTAAGTLELLAMNPDLKDALDKGWGIYNGAAKDAKLSAIADAKGYLDNGDTAGALRIVQEHKAADEAAGLPTEGYEQLEGAIQSGHGAAIANLMLASGAGPDKFAESYGKIGEEGRAAEMQPYNVQIKQTEAQFAPAKAQSELETASAQRQRMADQTANEIAANNIAQGRLALDQETLATNTQLKMAELDQTGMKLSPGSEKLVNDAAGEAAAAQMTADQEKQLATRIRSTPLPAGPNATMREKWKAIWGTQDTYTALRAEYAQMRNKGALANRANMPGAMSDADREFLLQGFPPVNADPAYVARFLETMARVHEATARQADAKATWIASNGSLGPARRDIVIDGYRVPKGMTFAQQQSAMAKISGPALPGDTQMVFDRARGQ